SRPTTWSCAARSASTGTTDDRPQEAARGRGRDRLGSGPLRVGQYVVLSRGREGLGDRQAGRARRLDADALPPPHCNAAGAAQGGAAEGSPEGVDTDRGRRGDRGDQVGEPAQRTPRAREELAAAGGARRRI